MEGEKSAPIRQGKVNLQKNPQVPTNPILNAVHPTPGGEKIIPAGHTVYNPKPRLVGGKADEKQTAGVVQNSTELPPKPKIVSLTPVVPSGENTAPAVQIAEGEKTDLSRQKEILPPQVAEKKIPSPPVATSAPVEEKNKSVDADETAAAPTELSDGEVTRRTAALWKYRPIPYNEPEPAPEYLRTRLSFAGVKFTAARVRGKKHKHEGSNSDDWYAVTTAKEAAIIAVADGAGSKKFSRIGAQIASESAVSFLRRELTAFFDNKQSDIKEASLKTSIEALALPMDSDGFGAACGALVNLVQRAAKTARAAVDGALIERAGDPRYESILKRELTLADFSTTLILAVIVPLKTLGEKLIVSCQIGDGCVVSLDTGGKFADSLRVLAQADSGAYSGETNFLTEDKTVTEEGLQRRTTVYRGKADTVLAMTDGVADDYFPAETQMRRLYFDLAANKILPVASSGLAKITGDLSAKIPAPIAYPWVNDQTKSVSLQYTKNICAELKMGLEELWTLRDVLTAARSGVSIDDGTSPDERLCEWLDNYVERGSFDDRTLVIVGFEDKNDER